MDDDDQQHSLLRSSDYRVEPCNPSGAIEELHRAIPYDLASDSNALTLYLRGSAYLGLKLGREPAAQFQKILDNHGLVTTHVNWPLAHLARAYALQDDPAKARAALSGFPRVLERRRH